jgi:hypothetical protein
MGVWFHAGLFWVEWGNTPFHGSIMGYIANDKICGCV